MNGTLISANLSLQVTHPSGQSLLYLQLCPRILSEFLFQKSLLENCQNRMDFRDEVRTLKSTCEKTQEQLRDKEKELATAQAENQTLRLQVLLTVKTM